MSILQEIVENKKRELPQLKKEIKKISPGMRPRDVIPFPPSHPFIIAEIKAASPSAGVIKKINDPAEIAQTYMQNGADAISIVVDRTYFKGDPCWIRDVASKVEVPVLFKEFVIDPWQIYFAYSLGADIVLLIASILDEATLKLLYKTARELGMEAIVEVHNKNELRKALTIEPKVVGINNRNLKTFEVNIETTLNLIKLIPHDVTVVSESGINNPDEIKKLLDKGVKGFLIGTSILKSSNIGEKLRELKNALG